MNARAEIDALRKHNALLEAEIEKNAEAVIEHDSELSRALDRIAELEAQLESCRDEQALGDFMSTIDENLQRHYEPDGRGATRTATRVLRELSLRFPEVLKRVAALGVLVSLGCSSDSRHVQTVDEDSGVSDSSTTEPCPGVVVVDQCVNIPGSVELLSKTAATSTCIAEGPEWSLCEPEVLCDLRTQAYVRSVGCDCNNKGCAKPESSGSWEHVYLHSAVVPFKFRIAVLGCGGGVSTPQCGSPTGGSALTLCCKAWP